jgi:hypothetical protein
VYEVSSHRVKEIGVFVYDVLVVEKEFVWLQQLLLLNHQLVCVFVVFHNLVIFHVVVRDCLSSKHYQGVLVDHVEAHKPYSAVDNSVQDNPRVSLNIQLLN